MAKKNKQKRSASGEQSATLRKDCGNLWMGNAPADAGRPMSEITDLLEDIAPLSLALDWDRVGLLSGPRDARVKRIFLTIDLTKAVAYEAFSWGADLVFSYHPPIF